MQCMALMQPSSHTRTPLAALQCICILHTRSLLYCAPGSTMARMRLEHRCWVGSNSQMGFLTALRKYTFVNFQHAAVAGGMCTLQHAARCPPPWSCMRHQLDQRKACNMFMHAQAYTYVLARAAARGVATCPRYWRRKSDFLVIPVLASTGVVATDRASAVLTGTATLPSAVGGDVDSGDNVAVTLVTTTVEVTVTMLPGDVAGATLGVRFRADGGSVSGWQLCVKWAHDGGTTAPWRVQGYPMVSNGSSVQATDLFYVGFPGFTIYSRATAAGPRFVA
jgi:hypothetical protein